MLNEELKKETTGFTKKEILKMNIQRDKLERSLGGIAEMKKTPELIFIIDTNVESLAVKEAQKWYETFECIKSLNIIPEAGHCPHDEMPEKVNPILKSIIQEAI